jgi:outer membrane usher protein
MTTTSVSGTPSGTNVTFDASKSMQPVPGSYGWRVLDSEGSIPYRSASGSYRSSVGQLDGYVQQQGQNTGASLQAQGAIVAMGGGVFMTNRIDDAFAVVKAGAPGVDVLYENRPAGKTDANGQLLIPSLRSYQGNKISIDPTNLPVDADAPLTQNIATPPNRSGVVVDFGVKTDPQAAVVILMDKTGKPVAPGSQGYLERTKEPFIVGYDGRAYLRGLDAANTVVVGEPGSECHAVFSYTPQRNSQVVIGPTTCE